MPMTGFTSTSVERFPVRSATISRGTTLIGVSLGPVTAEEVIEYRNPGFNGKSTDIADADRIVFRTFRVSATYLEVNPDSLSKRMQNVPIIDLGGGTKKLVPLKAMLQFAEGNYEDDLRFNLRLVDGNVIEQVMPKALCTFSFRGVDRAEGTMTLTFESRVEVDAGAGEEELVLTTLLVAGPATIEEGDTETYTQTGEDQNGDPIASSGGVWSVINGTGAATINSSTGVLTGVTAGTVTVRYTLGGVHDDHAVTVTAVSADAHLALVAALGGNSAVAGMYVTTKGTDGTKADSVVLATGEVAQWEDYRGNSGYGPAIIGTGAERPPFDATNKRILFDPVDGSFMATAAPFAGFDTSGVKTIVLVARVSAGNYALGVIPASAYASIIALEVTSGTIKTEMGSSFTSISSGVAVGSTIRAIIVSKNASTTGKIVVPNQAQVTAAIGALTAQDNHLRLGRLDTSPGPTIATMQVKAVLVLNIDADATQRGLIRDWAIANLEAAAA